MGLDSFKNSRIAEIERDLAAVKELDCHAPNCPLRWSVEVNGHRYCSGHAWAHRSLWDAITQENHQHLLRDKPAETPPSYKLTKAEQQAYLSKAKIKPNAPNKDWATRLQRLHQAGRRLSKFQINAYKTALKLHLEVTK